MNPLLSISREQKERLSGQLWCAAYSGGKDSTALVAWLEWLRRSGQLSTGCPVLVHSNTTVEDVTLMTIAHDMMNLLRSCGWECVIVTPKIHEKLYNRILGIGNTPVHPGSGHVMRWCTRATKIDPMNRWRKMHGAILTLTGLRWGESRNRDQKLAKKMLGCAAGGECGIPPPGESIYSPLLHWRTCSVIDLLTGLIDSDYANLMKDMLPITQRLVELYNIEWEQDGLFEDIEPDLSASRFGCIGCPAISATSCAPRATVKRNGKYSPLNELYDVWWEARKRKNRLVNARTGGYGPIKLEIRKLLFDRVMDIQERSGIMLISPEDEVFIRDCWSREKYPKGWSKADELNQPIQKYPLLFPRQGK